jgi:hypothetical protein
MATEAAPAPAPEKGPYTSNEVKTYKITGPIEITFTTKIESSHVPSWPPAPAPRGAALSGDAILAALQPFAEMILQKLDEIRNAQQDPH